jgi:nickel-dependent lactate racemase
MSQPRLRESLPDAFRHLTVEYHDPEDRKRLSYLATTRQGRRIYLNRAVVDADQIVVLSGRRYDPLLGYAGTEGLLYPSLSDEATRRALLPAVTTSVPGDEPWTAQREANEVAWLLGAPFMVQVIEGAGDEVVHVLGGLAATTLEGQRLLDARWRLEVPALADTVIASVSGDPSRHDFGTLAAAWSAAARVVKPRGRIVLLSQAQFPLGRGGEILRRTDDPENALALLQRDLPPDMAAAFQWANAAQNATLFLLSTLPSDTAEELFTVPLDNVEQVQRLITGSPTCLFLPDAHKTLAVLQD